MTEFSRLFDIDGQVDEPSNLLNGLLTSILAVEAARHGKAYAALISYLLFTYDLHKRHHHVYVTNMVSDSSWLTGCSASLLQLLQHYIESSGLSDQQTNQALKRAQSLWNTLQITDGKMIASASITNATSFIDFHHQS